MPVLIPQFKLKLGRCNVRAVANIRVTLSRNLLCDVAEIELPLLKETDLSKLKEGGAAIDGEVEISLGWEGTEPEPVFTGMIVEVSPDQPLKIKAEDFGCLLKQTRFQKTFKEKGIGPLGAEETWYSEIAAYAIAQAGLTPVVPIAHEESEGDLVRKSFTVDNQTCMQVLEKMRENGWDSFVIPCTKDCYFGPPWPWARGILKQPRRFKFAFGNDIRELGEIKYAPIVEPQELKFTPFEKIGKVVVHLTDSEFAKPAVTGSYGDGEPVKEFNFDVSDPTKAKAETRARNLYLKHDSKSVEGALKIFGNQFIKHSERVIVKDPAHPERGGEGTGMDLWLDEVTHEFGANTGFKTSLSVCQNEEKR